MKDELIRLSGNVRYAKHMTQTCRTFVSVGADGNPVFKPKVAFRTQEEAIEECKRINNKEHQFHKVTPYRCRECGKFHIGQLTLHHLQIQMQFRIFAMVW